MTFSEPSPVAQRSFTAQIRDEIVSSRPKSACCRDSMAKGIMFGSFGGTADPRAGDTGIVLSKLTPGGAGIGECRDLPDLTGSCENCVWNFVRGAFLACGNVSSPENSYHVEFLISEKDRADAFAGLLSGAGQSPGVIQRRGGRYGVYLKNSEEIFDLLGHMGAGKSAFRLLDAKIYRDIRNEANRVSNCELANIRRTVSASSEQMKAIALIIERGAVERLPEELRQTFDLRAAFPDDTLSELAEKHTPKITKSGVNHRLRRIVEFAGSL